MRVVFYPAFTEGEALTDQYFRAQWYLRPFHAHLAEVVLPHTLDAEAALIGAPPSYLDPAAATWAAPDELVKTRRVGGDGELATLIATADIVLIWDFPAGTKLPPLLKGKQFVNVDHRNQQYAGSHYLKIAERFFPEQLAQHQQYSQTVFSRIRDRCRRRVGYIFGTGPGLSGAAEHDFSDGVAIACNSMVRNHELLERLQPPLIVVGDPIFHAGPSSYAAAFRSELIAALDRYDADLIVPLRDYHIYRTHLPARFADRVAGIPFRSERAPHLDLGQSLHVTTTSNVLTLFLVPLAATFFEEIRIFGCDGRPLDQNGYFWAHDKASQFNEEMENIRKAHPAFFAINYDDYYLKHCETLEAWLLAAEALGKRISNHTPSYIPALIGRSAAGVPPAVEPAPIVSIVMPAFNVADFVEEAVKSVQAQDVTNWELIIVEDGSNDATLDVAARLSEADKRIKVLRNPRKGVSSARNVAIEASRGRYIAFLDADDVLDSGSLAGRVARLETDENIKLVHGAVRRIDENGRDLEWPFGHRGELAFTDMWRNPAHLNGLMGRGDFVRQFRFVEDIANGEDWLFLAQMLRSGATSSYVNDASAAWRAHANSTTFNAMKRHEENLVRVIDWVYGPALDADARYAAPLSSPPREEVLRQRAFSLLVWSIFAGDIEHASALLDDPGLKQWRLAQPLRARRTIVEAGAVRALRTPRSALPSIDAITRAKIESIISALDLKARNPVLAILIDDVFAFDGGAVKNLVGPFAREAARCVDEARLAADLFQSAAIEAENARPVMFDVGACEGGALAPFAEAGWEVHAFEPNPPAHQQLAQRVQAGVNVHRLALSDSSATQRAFFTSEESIGISTLSPFVPTHKATAYVDVARLDEFIDKHAIDRIDVLKVDTQGFDLMVLKGHDWSRIRPGVVICEFGDSKTKRLGYQSDDMAAFLADHGYTVYSSEWHPILRYGPAERRAWRRLYRWRPGAAPSNGWGNFIAFSNPIAEAALVKAVAAQTVQATPRPVEMPKRSPTLFVNPVLSAAVALPGAIADILVCDGEARGWELSNVARGDAWFPLGGADDLALATRLVERRTAGPHGISRSVVGSGAAIEFSGFLRAAGRSLVAISVGQAEIVVDLDRCVLASKSPGAEIIFADAQRSTGEWGAWRQFRLVAAVPPGEARQLRIGLCRASGDRRNYLGDGSSGVDVWGLHALAVKALGDTRATVGAA